MYFVRYAFGLTVTYKVEHGGQTITVFSAPNYCDQMGNKGSLKNGFETKS